MYRSSLTMAFVVLYSAAAAASDIYLAPGAVYAPSAMFMCVRHRPIGNRLTQNPVTDIGSLPITERSPHTAHRHLSTASTARPTPRDRSTSNARPPIPSVTTLPSVPTLASPLAQDRYYGEGRDYALSMRRGRRHPCPTVRVLDAMMVMAGGSPAIR